jgi:AAA15 family ATPase/GTPase
MSKEEKHWNDAWLKSARLTNYKSIRDMTVEFKPGLNIIIGRNGSGKTNLMEYLEKILDIDLISLPGDAEFIFVNQPQHLDFHFRCVRNLKKELAGGDSKATLNKFTWEYRINSEEWKEVRGSKFHLFHSNHIEFETQFIKHGTVQSAQMLSSNLDLIVDGEGVKMPEYNFKWKSEPSPLPFIVKEFIGDIEAHFREKYYNEDGNKWELIQGNIEHVEGIVGEFKRFKSIIDIISNFTQIKGIRLAPNGVQINDDDNGVYISGIQLEFLVEGKWLKYNQLSDGTKRLFLLVSTIIPECKQLYLKGASVRKIEDGSFPKILLLEEPEMGIHPQQLFELMTFIKAQSRNQQIILTTHSPTVLDVLDVDELDRVLVCNYTQEKGTQLQRLNPNTIKKVQAYVKENFKISDAWLHSPNFEPNV